MYRILMRQGWDGQEILIHSEIGDGPRLQTAKLALATSSTATLTAAAGPNNPLYQKVTALQTFIRVYRTDKRRRLFSGRVWTIQPGMATDGTLTTEITALGLEDFLHDSVQPWKEYKNVTPKGFLQALLNEHNQQVEPYKQMKLGVVTVTNSTDNVYRFTDDTATTYDTIQDKLITRLGGEIRVREEADGLYLDYMPEISQQSNQVIRLASNMMSLTQKLDPAAVFTILKPLGKAADRTSTATDGSSTTATSTPRLTIESVNGGSPYLRDEALIKQFGEITVPQTWDDVTTASALKTKGQATLAAQQPVKEQIQITAADLSFVNSSIDDFQCGSYNRIINQLLGYDAVRRIVSQDIDICSPSSSTMQAGDVVLSQESYVRQITLAARTATSLAEQTASLSSQYVTVDGALAQVQAKLLALSSTPFVKLTAGPGMLQLTYNITEAGTIPAGTQYTAEITQDLNTWTAGSTIDALTGRFTVDAAGQYFVRVKGTTTAGYETPYSQPASINVEGSVK